MDTTINSLSHLRTIVLLIIYKIKNFNSQISVITILSQCSYISFLTVYFFSNQRESQSIYIESKQNKYVIAPLPNGIPSAAEICLRRKIMHNQHLLYSWDFLIQFLSFEVMSLSLIQEITSVRISKLLYFLNQQ